MTATNGRIITVFGGTGFLGRRVVRQLRSSEFRVRIASRHPDQGYRLFGRDDPQLQSVDADIRQAQSVSDALAGAYGAVNAVSLYVEQGPQTFRSVHVEAARQVAAAARRAAVERFVHVSGLGVDAASPSRYIRMRGEGELAVRAAFANACFVRPAVMFGPDDAFLTTIITLLRRLPIYPMFGRGLARLQPVDVEDVAAAVVQLCRRAEINGTIFELGGLRVYSYRRLLRAVGQQAGRTPLLIPVPFAAWHALARLSELLPGSLLTRNQVELMQIDTVASPQMPGFADLGISPHGIESTIQRILPNR